MNTTALQSHFHKTLTILFLLIIFIPSLKMFFTPQADWSRVEKRRLAEHPAPPRSLAQMTIYFSGIEEYLGDHFGYREFLIKRYHREMKKRFGKIGNESNVLLGEKGWFFYSAGDQIEDYLGHLKLSEKQLNNWVAERKRRAVWCKQRGIEYFLVVPPNKQNIYPEYLPPKVAPFKGTSRFEQLLDLSGQNHLPFLVDLSQPLRQAKNEKELFYKTDSHWNLRGAFIGFTAILEALQKSFADTAFTTNFTFGPDVIKPCDDNPDLCDLAWMAMQQKEATITCQTLAGFHASAQPDQFDLYGFTNLQERQDTPSFARKSEKGQLTALIFRDSFFVSLEPFFSENFKHSIYLWKTYDQKNIEQALKVRQVDLVIEEVVEGFLFNEIND